MKAKLAVLVLVVIGLFGGCKTGSVNVNGNSSPPVVTATSGEAAIRMQVAINLDRARLGVESAIVIKRDLRKDKLIDHDQELAVTEALSEGNNAIIEALSFMQANPSFDISTTGDVARLVGNIGTSISRVAGNRLPPKLAAALQKITDASKSAGALFN